MVMLAGDVSSFINSALAEASANRKRAEQTVESATRELTDLQTREAESFKSLAQVRMDVIKSTPIVSTLLVAEQETKRKMEAFETLSDRLQKQRAEAEAKLKQLAEQRTKSLEQVEAARKDIKSLRESTRARLEPDPQWHQLFADDDRLVEQVSGAEQKMDDSRRDWDSKSKSYLADDLFMYLWNRGYGTRDYQAGRFTRWGDSFVARTIGYDKARQGFYWLNEIPKRVGDYLANLTQELDAHQIMLETRFHQELEKDGVIPLEKNLEQAVRQRDALQKAIHDQENAMQAIDTQIEQLMSGDHPQGPKAMASDLAVALKREDLRSLYNEAMKSPTPEDERIVETISKLRMRLMDLQKRLPAQTTSLQTLRNREAQLRAARDAMYQYDWSGGSFLNAAVIQAILDGLITGTRTSRDLESAMRQGYRRTRRRNDDWGGGSWGGGLGGGGGGWGGGLGGGGGFGGGGFSGGGGFGGGGFRTGGGF
ncbi:MAG: hypothetical protein LBR29_01545 [Methylobacteriaceae bacterium]|jgi:DNA repair exonuclease SbcCD ATPase subunit|nr:hypothetical protein [Methylobacteriaceae bacterium]